MDVEKYKGACLRATRRMALLWKLSPAEAAAASGVPDLMQGGEDFDENALLRVSVLLCVWSHVSWRFQDKGARWIREPNDFFSGVKPIDLMVSDNFSDALRLRRGFDQAEMEMLAGYTTPDYPVRGYLVEQADGKMGTSFMTRFEQSGQKTGRKAREDGGPGRFASEEELSSAMRQTADSDAGVLDYLRDK